MKKNNIVLSIVSVFLGVLLFGLKSEQVIALEKKLHLESSYEFKYNDLATFHMKKVVGDSNTYAFCLDSNFVFSEGVSYNANSEIFKGQRNKIEQVILKAFLKGLRTDVSVNDKNTTYNEFGLTNNDFYQVTQMSVWYAAHGESKGGLRSTAYINWLNADSKRKNAFDYLVGSQLGSVNEYSISLKSEEETMSIDESGKYMISGNYTIVGSSDLDFTVEVDKKDKDACVLYNGKCLVKQTVKGGDSFKLRTSVLSEGEYMKWVYAYINSEEYFSGYEFELYSPNGLDPNTGKTVQNAATFKPKYSQLKSSVSTIGSYSNLVEIEIEKVNGQGIKVAGAKLGIYNSKNEELFVITSAGQGNENKKISLGTGSYYVKELEAPKGHIKSEEKIEFSIDKDGNIKDKDGNVISLITIINDNYLDVSKTDATGQKEIGGASMELYNSNGELYDSWTSEADKEHRIIGLNVDEIYKIVETLAPKGYAKLSTSIYFKLNIDGTVTTCDSKIAETEKKCEALSNEDILKIKNEITKVSVSKLDKTTGEHIEGVTLQIFNKDGSEAYDINGNLLKWVTDGKIKEIEGLAVGEYYIKEMVYIDGYEQSMIVNDNTLSQYEFSITNEDPECIIVVYNEIIDTPNTGLNSLSYIIGSIIILAGLGTIVIASKKKEIL